jgi:hypothetical protein
MGRTRSERARENETEDRIKYAWTPQRGPQTCAIYADHIPVLFFGGARGGGKSDYLLADYYQDVYTYGRHWQGILFRRTYPELEGLIQRAKGLFQDAEWYEGKRLFQWKNGASLKMRHAEKASDVTRYQGHQYGWVGFDEITNQKDIQVFRELTAINRWAEIPLKNKRIRLSGNPGGVGHSWVKKLFIDPEPAGYKLIEDGDFKRIFIPSKVQDNRILMEADPDYITNLQNLGSPELVRAWLEGDWNVTLGSYFPEFGQKHIIPPQELPKHWMRFRSMDWGFHAPSTCLWIAVSDGTVDGIPEGALVVYRELQKAQMTAEEFALKVKELTDEHITYSVCDPSMFTKKSQIIRGPSLAEVFKGQGVLLSPADNERIAGWIQIRQRLRGNALLIFSTCKELIAEIPLLQHDKKHPEDLDSNGQDHLADALRYGCMSRPFVKREPLKPKEIRGISNMRFDELNQLAESEYYNE